MGCFGVSWAVVIPSRLVSNLRPCLEAIQRMEPGARIVVVDDGLEAKPPGPEYVEGVKPFSFASNVNRGIKRAGTDDVVVMNDDALLKTQGGFRSLSAFAAAHLECGCVAPATNVTGQALQMLQHRSPTGWRYVNNVPYVCVYLRRAVLDKVGPLSEEYGGNYGAEDTDHILMMRKKGFKVAVVYGVYVDHGSLWSTFRGDPRSFGDCVVNMGKLRRKWGRV